jgi:hypothetical protein
MTALYDALLQGQTDGAVERLLRLLIQNIPRCGDDSHLRRMVVMLASAEGLFGEAQPVVERALSIDIARGDLLGAAATISLASTVGVPTAPLWDRLDDAIWRPSGRFCRALDCCTSRWRWGPGASLRWTPNST